ncbi:hypothetical protein [Tenacibaculum aquimarinum]|uniref:hypothetical protein n=1 Tax=Tenacibaculum aquimarinum TaxID=2910675 RepID=UPI001F0B2AA7|nr:hypothetical protein [Tenacibaculum aquimarinum]MCH3883481.1 hypothetical protein [Tenacibaculum aquimarinum]
MKNLELNQMETLQGGDCGTGFGAAAGVALIGLAVIASGPVGWGAAIYLAGGASIWGVGVFCED